MINCHFRFQLDISWYTNDNEVYNVLKLIIIIIILVIKMLNWDYKRIRRVRIDLELILYVRICLDNASQSATWQSCKSLKRQTALKNTSLFSVLKLSICSQKKNKTFSLYFWAQLLCLPSKFNLFQLKTSRKGKNKENL